MNGGATRFLKRLLLRRALVVFLYHEVSDHPSSFNDLFGLNVPPDVFARQLDLIRKHFHLIDPPVLLKGDYPTPAALITFDDGNKSYFREALPLLRQRGIPSVVFMNLGPVRGEVCWSGLVTYLQHFEPAFRKIRGKALWDSNEYRSFTFSEVQRYLDSVDQEDLFARVRQFRGPVADEKDLESVSGDPSVFLGNHLYQHYNATQLVEERLKQEYRQNQQILDSNPRGVRLLSYPFSCFDRRTATLLHAEGVEGFFGGGNAPNWNGRPSGPGKFYRRLELNERVLTESEFLSSILKKSLSHLVRGFLRKLQPGVLRGWLFVRQVHRGTACDVDTENRKAYEIYPFPYPMDTDYSRYTLSEAQRMLETFRRANRSLWKACGLDPRRWQGKVLWDLGCGVGWRAMAFAADGAEQVHALDVSENALRLGEHFCRLLKIQNVHFHRGSLYDLSRILPEPKPDLIFSTGTLHHVFDLSRVARTLAQRSRPGTEFYFTHSSASSRLGLVKYFKNYSSWAKGGLDLEARLEAGKSIWKRWVQATPESLRKNHLNDLAGVFYMARGCQAIRRVFSEAGFEIQSFPVFRTRTQLLEVWRENGATRSASAGKRWLKKGLFTGMTLACAVPLPGFLDRAAANGLAWLFEMRPRLFRAVVRGDR